MTPYITIIRVPHVQVPFRHLDLSAEDLFPSKYLYGGVGVLNAYIRFECCSRSIQFNEFVP
jgi:hypothetical protein